MAARKCNSNRRNRRLWKEKTFERLIIVFLVLFIYLLISVIVVDVIIGAESLSASTSSTEVEASNYSSSDTVDMQIVEGVVVESEQETNEEEATEKGSIEKEDLADESSVSQSEVDLGEETETKNQNSFSEEEVYLLAQAMTCEGESLSSSERMAIGQVILNRVNSDWIDFQNVNTIAEVLAQKGQYTATWRKIQNGKSPTAQSLEEARELLELNSNGEVYSYQGYSMEGVLWQCSKELEINLNMSLVELCNFSGTYHDFYKLTA